MSTPEPEEYKRREPIVKYAMISFYFLFIGFCAAGIILKWDALVNPTQYRMYSYEEGFGSVNAEIPRIVNERPSFLDRLTRRGSRKMPPIKLPERNIGASHRWEKYAAPAVIVPKGNATVIIVIDDLGIVKDTTKAIVNMDAPMTLSFLPYASEINRQVNDAYNKGHDILVHIPMEPKGRADPGPYALLSSSDPLEQMESIDYNLSQFENYIGINNHMGSLFTEDVEAVNRLLNVIKNKGLLVLDSKTTSKSQLEKLALEQDIPTINRDVFLDDTEDVGYIMGQLKELERMALKTGTALAIGHPYPQTVTALRRWIPTLAAKGITIVPISQTVREKYAQTLLANK